MKNETGISNHVLGNEPNLSLAGSVHQAIRLMAALMGLLVMLAAILYTVRGLEVLLRVYRQPDEVQHLVTAWSEVLGGDELLVVESNGKEVSWARPIALWTLLVGAMLYFAACSSFLVAGARVLSTALGRQSS